MPGACEGSKQALPPALPGLPPHLTPPRGRPGRHRVAEGPGPSGTRPARRPGTGPGAAVGQEQSRSLSLRAHTSVLSRAPQARACARLVPGWGGCRSGPRRPRRAAQGLPAAHGHGPAPPSQAGSGDQSLPSREGALPPQPTRSRSTQARGLPHGLVVEPGTEIGRAGFRSHLGLCVRPLWPRWLQLWKSESQVCPQGCVSPVAQAPAAQAGEKALVGTGPQTRARGWAGQWTGASRGQTPSPASSCPPVKGALVA